MANLEEVFLSAHDTIVKMKIIIFSLLFLLITSKIALAGGGRIEIYTMDNLNGYYYVNSDTYVLAQVFVPDSSNTIASVGERAEFRIENPRDGDTCINEIEQTTELGLLRARCRVTQPGTVTVYVYSFADNYESSRYLLHFYAQPEATIVPTQRPTAIPPTQAVEQPTVPSNNSRPSPTIVVPELVEAAILDSSDQELDEELVSPTQSAETTPTVKKQTSDTKRSESSSVILALALAMFGTIAVGTGIVMAKAVKTSR